MTCHTNTIHGRIHQIGNFELCVSHHSNEDTRRIAILLGSDGSIQNVLQAESSGAGKEKPDSE